MSRTHITLKKQVEAWIIKTTEKKRDKRLRFYASEIAEDLDVDILKIMNILDELKKEGKVCKPFER